MDPLQPDTSLDGDLKIGFIAIREVETGAYRGGLLVTDAAGKPLEFRATEAVRPNTAQVVIYGASLIPAIAQDLCGRPLIESLRESPEVLVADSEVFLPLGTPELPVVCVTSSPSRDGGELGEQDDGTTIVRPVADGYKVLELRFAADATEENKRRTRTHLALMSQVADAMEPFERLARVLDILEEQDTPRKG